MRSDRCRWRCDGAALDGVSHVILGAILAGGRSTRFGSDKALAMIDGTTLIERNAAALARQVDRLVICGRDYPPYLGLADRPRPDLGPLGGLAAALHFAVTCNFSAVLSLPVDALHVPGNLIDLLGKVGPTHFREQHLIGVWPATVADALDAHLVAGNRSVRSWISACAATSVGEPHPVGNANSHESLRRFLQCEKRGDTEIRRTVSLMERSRL